MKWTEIIKLRSSEKNLKKLVLDITESAFETFAEKGLNKIKIFRHALLNTDISIHLNWDTETVPKNKSSLSLELIKVFENYGLTFHSAWIEMQESEPEV